MLASTEHVNRHGGKGRRLLELQAAGFRVPEFLISPDDVEAAVRHLGTPLVVRSSANFEDGAHASMAGQFRSFLNLHSIEEVERAIEQCRASADCETVRSYCRRHGLEHSSLHIDVIVQRMVQPQLAGVAFTINPMTGAEEVTIEACAGHGEDLLSGRCGPLPASDPLLCQHRSLIENTARQIQRHYGAPQDVEFAIEGGTLYVLQTRPITRIGFPPSIGEWTNADFRDGGVSSSVCTPLMWSLYDLVWEHSLKRSLSELHLLGDDFQAGRMFFGRPYWNLGAVKECLAKLPGFVERELDEDLSVACCYEGDGHRTPVTLGRILSAIRTLLAMRRFLIRQEKVCQQMLSGGIERVMTRYDATTDDVIARFGELIECDYLFVESSYFRTIFAASLAKMDFKSSFPDAPYGSLTTGLPPLRHMDPVRRVQQLSCRTDAALDEVIDEFPHHCRSGIDICHPRWDEDREFVRAMLGSLSPATPPQLRSAAELSHGVVSSHLPWHKRRKHARKLAVLRHFVWLREEMRDISNRMYWLVRRYVLEIARRRGWGDDIYFMTYREILAGDTSHVDERRATYESYRNFKAPNEIGRSHVPQDAAGPGALSGLGAGPGIGRGRAFVARNVEQAMAMPPGSILVSPFIDPGWTPVLNHAAAVVTETGGLLSHAAVICREFGLPAVLAVVDATTRIPHGSCITVDGHSGQVDISPSEQ